MLTVLTPSIFVFFDMKTTAPIYAHAVNFKSKGTSASLTKEWFLRYTGISASNAVTLPQINEKLKQIGQIKRILKLNRHFSDNGIDVEIEEHHPAMKTSIPSKSGEREIRIISTDGTIYKGINYGDLLIARLPELVDATPVIEENDEVRIPGMESIVRLLACARQHNPNFHRLWEHVSVRDFKEGRADIPGARIHVRLRQSTQPPGSAKIRDLIFSANTINIETQFAIYSAPAFQNSLSRELRSQPNLRYDLRLYLENKITPASPRPEPRLTPAN
jgi:hypothetical protein